jgi:peptidoglycan hydrolase-like protein with peptidoglycan-binding domain
VGEPRRNVAYTLVIDGVAFNGNTDNDGWIEVAIPPNARHGELTVGDEFQQQVISLELGGMDPITETIGVQKRLRNLGFACDPTGEIDEATSAAIVMFQKGEKLKPTGELDQPTIDKLKVRHGS